MTAQLLVQRRSARRTGLVQRTQRVGALSLAGSNTNLAAGLFDIRKPRLNGSGVLRELKRSGVYLATILLTTFEDVRFSSRLSRPARGELLLQPVITERVMRIVQGMKNKFETRADPEQLTPRERDVLRLIAARTVSGKSRRHQG